MAEGNCPSRHRQSPAVRVSRACSLVGSGPSWPGRTVGRLSAKSSRARATARVCPQADRADRPGQPSCQSPSISELPWLPANCAMSSIRSSSRSSSTTERSGCFSSKGLEGSTMATSCHRKARTNIALALFTFPKSCGVRGISRVVCHRPSVPSCVQVRAGHSLHPELTQLFQAGTQMNAYGMQPRE
jgi:hypothetical protein